MNTILSLSCILIFRLALGTIVPKIAMPETTCGIATHSIFADTMLGRNIRAITAQGQFSLFDKQHSDRAFINDGDGMTMNVIFTAPEMDCFLANHAKDDLQFTYEVHEVEHPDSKSERMNYLLRIVSLKTGDDTRIWTIKESNDSTLIARHHEQLKKCGMTKR